MFVGEMLGQRPGNTYPADIRELEEESRDPVRYPQELICMFIALSPPFHQLRVIFQGIEFLYPEQAFIRCKAFQPGCKLGFINISVQEEPDLCGSDRIIKKVEVS